MLQCDVTAWHQCWLGACTGHCFTRLSQRRLKGGFHLVRGLTSAAWHSGHWGEGWCNDVISVLPTSLACVKCEKIVCLGTFSALWAQSLLQWKHNFRWECKEVGPREAKDHKTEAQVGWYHPLLRISPGVALATAQLWVVMSRSSLGSHEPTTSFLINLPTVMVGWCGDKKGQGP